MDFSKAQGASERAERQPSELEWFSERGRDRIGHEVSGCSEMELSLTKCGVYCHGYRDGNIDARKIAKSLHLQDLKPRAVEIPEGVLL